MIHGVVYTDPSYIVLSSKSRFENTFTNLLFSYELVMGARSFCLLDIQHKPQQNSNFSQVEVLSDKL